MRTKRKKKYIEIVTQNGMRWLFSTTQKTLITIKELVDIDTGNIVKKTIYN